MTPGFVTVLPGLAAAQQPSAPPAVLAVLDFGDFWADYEALAILDFGRDDYGAREWSADPGAFRAEPYARPPIGGALIAMDLGADLYAAGAYARPPVAGAMIVIDFGADIYRGT
jgi:hypothetical protein